jgi:peptidoglycan-associated lipoprotein
MRVHNLLFAISFASIAGCAHQEATPRVTIVPTRALVPPPPPTTTTSAPLATGTSGLGVSADLLKACQLHFDDARQAPRFDFDTSDLADQDRALLQQVATCVTTGPLKGRGLHLVGRADPRGEVEYNRRVDIDL